jgi:rsbT co-antagonist protein RsbR
MRVESRLPELLGTDAPALLAEWMREQTARGGWRPDLISEGELRAESKEFLELLAGALRRGGTDLKGAEWEPVLAFLTRLSRSRGQAGFAPSETATFVLSLKQPLFERLRADLRDQPDLQADQIWAVTELLDRLGLFTTEIHQKTREELILRQKQEMLELSTPVVRLWDGVLALPLIGALDSSRTQVVMETLLEKIVETRSRIAIIDITGVPTVDTLVAQHLLKTVAAARLMGADCIISGIRPQIAQTIVQLGVELGDVVTKSSLADAFTVALSRLGMDIGRSKA